MIIEKRGNIFTTKAQTIVNTINCVGVMGAGIAYEFKLRERDMFEKYKKFCEEKQIDIGKLWIYNSIDSKTSYQKILNFPTKVHWRYPSKEEYIHKGLQKFVDTYRQKNITSIAFPLLGADKGGLGVEKSFSIMKNYLSKCDIDVEIWFFDPMAKDDLYEDFRKIFLSIDDETIKKETKIRGISKVRDVKDALLNRSDINSLSALKQVKGIGDKTLEKIFDYVKNYKKPKTLF